MAVFKKPCSLSIMSNEGMFPRPLPLILWKERREGGREQENREEGRNE